MNINIKPNARLTMADMDKLPGTLPCLLGWKDRDSCYLGITDYMIEYSGLESRDTLMGKNDHAITRFDGLADHFIYCDQYAMNVKAIHFTEKTFNANNEMVEVVVSKHPIYDDSQEKVIGVFFCGFPVSEGFNVKHFDSLDSNSTIVLSSTHYILEISKNQCIQLSERESRVLYYYLRGRTSRQIGDILSLSFRTIEDHITSIKCKLHCTTRADVIDLVITLGLFDFIPVSVMSHLQKKR